MVQNYLKLTEEKKPIGKNLQTIVRLTKHRNLNAQKIGSKNEALRQMVYDMQQGRLVKNDGGQQYGLYGFCETFSPRRLMYNLSQQVAESPILTQVKNRSRLETQ